MTKLTWKDVELEILVAITPALLVAWLLMLMGADWPGYKWVPIPCPAEQRNPVGFLCRGDSGLCCADGHGEPREDGWHCDPAGPNVRQGALTLNRDGKWELMFVDEIDRENTQRMPPKVRGRSEYEPQGR